MNIDKYFKDEQNIEIRANTRQRSLIRNFCKQSINSFVIITNPLNIKIGETFYYITWTAKPVLASLSFIFGIGNFVLCSSNFDKTFKVTIPEHFSLGIVTRFIFKQFYDTVEVIYNKITLIERFQSCLSWTSLVKPAIKRNSIKAFTAKQLSIYFKQPDETFFFWKHAVIRIWRFHLHQICWKHRRQKFQKILNFIWKPVIITATIKL